MQTNNGWVRAQLLDSVLLCGEHNIYRYIYIYMFLCRFDLWVLWAPRDTLHLLPQLITCKGGTAQLLALEMLCSPHTWLITKNRQRFQGTGEGETLGSPRFPSQSQASRDRQSIILHRQIHQTLVGWWVCRSNLCVLTSPCVFAEDNDTYTHSRVLRASRRLERAFSLPSILASSSSKSSSSRR